MEFHKVQQILRPKHLAEEKQQMLSLNRRLETYLNRVKLLEEENSLLANEIQHMRCHSQGGIRESLEEELRRARLALDEVWQDRLITELEVGKLGEELQALDELRRREAQAKMKAKTKLEESRKELEEERRNQMWLRERVAQLENDMKFLVQNHQEDVAHFEAKLMHARTSVPHTMTQRSNQKTNLLQLGQEYSQRATRVWQEAAETYQGQLSRLEESLTQTRGCLTQMGHEKRENQLKLQALEKEMNSAQDVRRHLEITADQQREVHSHEIQQLQEHLEGLEVEKEELGAQIDHLVLENRDLLQMKMSLGLEVATYRALLDGEGFRGDIPFKQPKNIPISDAVFSSRGVKKMYPIQLSAGHTSSFLSDHCKTEPASSTPLYSRKAAALDEIPKISRQPSTKSETQETPYLKIQPGGAVESLTPQKVHEKVAHPEALVPSDEQEVVKTVSGNQDEKESWNNVEPFEETSFLEPAVKHQVEFSLKTEPYNKDEAGSSQSLPLSRVSSKVQTTEESCGFSEPETNVTFKCEIEKKDAPQEGALVEAWGKKESGRSGVVNDQDSDSETEAMLEPTWESRPSSPESECVTEDMVTEFNLDENASKEALKRQIKSSMMEMTTKDGDDKLYPDGEEMDTWDSVIERKVDLKISGAVKTNDGKGQHAEPEEDISAKEPEGKKKETMQEFTSDVKQEDYVGLSKTVTEQVDDGMVECEHALLHDKDENDDEDSQNVSVSWRLESDSYAQDNTLADTRPLIRYKSDETDANTLASHMDESESSEGEQDRKVGEMGIWSQQFGTMEDLCEEVEGEILDEEYNLGYIPTEDVNTAHGVGESCTEEIVNRPNDEHSDEETEKLVKPTHEVSDVEMKTEKLNKQQLENSTQDNITQSGESEEAEETKTENLGVKSVDPGLIPSTTLTNQTSKNLCSANSSVATAQTDTMTQWDLPNKDQEVIGMSEERQKEYKVTHTDPLEVHSIVSNTDTKEVNISEVCKSASLLKTAEDRNVTEAEELVASQHSQKDEDAADSQEVYGSQKCTEAADLKEKSENSSQQIKRDIACDQYLLENLPQIQSDVAETFKEPPKQLIEDHHSVSSNLQEIQSDGLSKASEESQKKVTEDVVHSQELSGNLQHMQSESLMQITKQTQKTLVEDVPVHQELSGCFEGAQPDIAMVGSKEMIGVVADCEDLSRNQQPPSDGKLEALKDSEVHVVEEVEDIHEQTQRQEPQKQLAEVIASCQELSGSLEPPKLDYFVEASRKTLSESLQLPETCKMSEEEHTEDIAPSQELYVDLQQSLPDIPKEAYDLFPEDQTEDVSECQEFPDAPQPAEWEVLGKPGGRFQIKDQKDLKCDLEVGSSSEDQEKPLEVYPDSVPGEHNILTMQGATDGGLREFFPPATKNDFWVSSLESGATFQPDDTCNEAAEQTNQNVGFANNIVWGVSNQQNVFNGTSRVDSGSLKAPGAKKEQKQIQAEMEQVLCRNVLEGETVHSEESEVEGESWSSEE